MIVLSDGLDLRYHNTKSKDDFENALRRGKDVLKAIPSHDPERFGLLFMLGHLVLGSDSNPSLYRGYISRAVQLAKEAVSLGCVNDGDPGFHLHLLGTALHARYELARVVDDLNEAHDLAKQSVKETPIGHRRRTLYLHTLSVVLGGYYGATGSHSFLEYAICRAEYIVDQEPVLSPMRLIYLITFSRCLDYKYLRTGDLEDIAQWI